MTPEILYCSSVVKPAKRRMVPNVGILLRETAHKIREVSTGLQYIRLLGYSEISLLRNLILYLGTDVFTNSPDRRKIRDLTLGIEKFEVCLRKYFSCMYRRSNIKKKVIRNL